MVNSVGTELRATLPGTAGTADARRALAVLDRFLSLVGQLEDVALNKRATRADERSVAERWLVPHRVAHPSSDS
jgi:hypothetical protein